MTRMYLISVADEEEVGGGSSFGSGASTQWNIFIALSVFVDQRRITPSRDPEAKKFAVEWERYTW